MMPVHTPTPLHDPMHDSTGTRLSLAQMRDILQQEFSVAFSCQIPAAADASIPTGASLDSRDVQAGDLFVCIHGERVDGHDYAAMACTKGACAVLAEHMPVGLPAALPVLLCPDVPRALAVLARAYRLRTRAYVIGITGTAGKTSVKEVLAQVLAEAGSVSKNYLNLNNYLGLSLSILRASPEATFWVLEAGISQETDMAELGDILRPDCALILNAGMGHTQGLGAKGVAYHKASLLAYLAPDGIGLVNADMPELVREAKAYSAKSTLFFFSGQQAAPVEYGAQYLGPAPTDVTCPVAMQGRFLVRSGQDAMELLAPFRDSLGAENVAAITSVAATAGLDLATLARGMRKAVLPQQRFNCIERAGFTLIDDSYNANPLSCTRVLSAVAGMRAPAGQALYLVMGEMGELGADAQAAHVTLGQQMAAVGPVAVVWKGGMGAAVAEGLALGGFSGEFTLASDVHIFCDAVVGWKAPALILFKGSRSNALEQFVKAFLLLLEAATLGEKGVI